MQFALAVKPEKANLSGRWLNTRSEGDMRRFFAEGLEVGCPVQLIACCMNYGTGKLEHIIEQDGKKSVTVTQTWPEQVTTTFICDGKPHSSGQPGDPGYVAKWVGSKLVITPGAGAASDKFINTRYMEGDELVTHFSFANKDVFIKRYFTLQP